MPRSSSGGAGKAYWNTPTTSNGWTSGSDARTEGSTRRGGATSTIITPTGTTTTTTTTTIAATVVDRVQVIVVVIAKLFGRKWLVGLMLQSVVGAI